MRSLRLASVSIRSSSAVAAVPGRFALLFLLLFGAQMENDDDDGGGDAQQQNDDDEGEIHPALEMEQSSEAERQKRGNQNHDDGKHVGEQGDPPKFLFLGAFGWASCFPRSQNRDLGHPGSCVMTRRLADVRSSRTKDKPESPEDQKRENK